MSLQTDLDNLTAAINSGARTVSHNGKTVTYHSIAEMKMIQNDLRNQIASGLAGRPQVHYARLGSGRSRQ